MSGPSEPATLGGFTPFNELHAIYSCAVTLNFTPCENGAPAVHDDFLRLVRQEAKKLNLGIGAPSYGLNITFEPTGINLAINRPPKDQRGPVIGQEFSETQDDGRVKFRVMVSQDTIYVQTFDYIRWAPFLSRVRSICQSFLPLYRGECLAFVRVEYIDRFESSADAEQQDVWAVVNPNSSFVPKELSTTTDLWHSHVGTLSKSEFSLRRLLQANIDVTENNETRARVVSIRTVLQDDLKAVEKMPEPWARAFDCVESQHSKLKDVIKLILTPEARDRIGLGA